MIKNDQIYGALLALCGAILFAGKAIIIKWIYIHHSIPTLPLLALRMIFSVPFYLFILYRVTQKEPMKLDSKDKMQLVITGLLGYYMASYLDFKGLEYISATLERLILFIYPTLVVLISVFFLNKKITKNQVVALLVTYLGVVFAFIPDMRLGGNKNLYLGSALIFFSALTYALYLIGSGQLVKKLGSQRLTAYSLLIATTAVMIHYLIADNSSLMDFEPEVYLLSLVMAVFSTVIPTFMVAEAIKRVGASSVSIISTIGPMATIVLATQVLGEQFSIWHLVGTCFIVGGVLIISLKKSV